MSDSVDFAESEVEQLDTVRRHHHISGFEIAVQDALAVRRCQRSANVDRELHRDVQRHRAGQRHAIQVYHDQEIHALMGPDVMERTDVGMIQGCHCARASRSKRSRAWGAVATCAGSTLIATVRSRRVSVAL